MTEHHPGLSPQCLARARTLGIERRFGSRRQVRRGDGTKGGYWIVLEGVMQVLAAGRSEKPGTLLLARPGELVHLEEDGPAAVALVPSLLVALTENDLKALANQSPEDALELAGAALRFHDRLCVRLLEVLIQPVEERILGILGLLAEVAGRRQADDGWVIDLPLSHQDLASYVGSSREMVTYVLRQLREKGVLAPDKTAVVLRSPAPAGMAASYA